MNKIKKLKFSETTNKVIRRTMIEARHFGFQRFTPECMFLSLVIERNSPGINVLNNNNIDIKDMEDIRNIIRKIYDIDKNIKKEKRDVIIPGDRNSKLIIAKTEEYTKKFKMKSIEPDILLLVILEKPEKSINTILEFFNLNAKDLHLELIKYLNNYNKNVGSYYTSNQISRKINKNDKSYKAYKEKNNRNLKINKEIALLKIFNEEFEKQKNLLKKLEFSKPEEPAYRSLFDNSEKTEEEIKKELNTIKELIEKTKKNSVKDIIIKREQENLIKNKFYTFRDLKWKKYEKENKLRREIAREIKFEANAKYTESELEEEIRKIDLSQQETELFRKEQLENEKDAERVEQLIEEN